MKLKAPPYSDIAIAFDQPDLDEEGSPGELDPDERAAIVAMWPKWWPAYREVLQQQFSRYEHDDLLKKRTRVNVEKLVPNRKVNYGANLLLRFSFDKSGITWDIFQKGRTIVHAQPVF